MILRDLSTAHEAAHLELSYCVNEIATCREKPVSKKKSDLNRGISRKKTHGNGCHPEAQTVMNISIPNGALGRKTLCLVRPGDTPSIEDAIARLHADADLSSLRRRDLISSLRRIAAAVGSPVGEVPADLQWLRQKLAATSATCLGQSPKTRANVLSNALAALAHSGVAARRPSVDRSMEWDRLWQHLRPSEKIALGSFARFCSFHKIDPTKVTDYTVREYREAIVQSSLRKKPDEAIRELTVCWNKAKNLVAGWPAQQLTVPSRRVIISSPIEALPHSFRKDLDKYVSQLQNTDLLAEEAGPPLASATIKFRRLQVRRFFGELVASGVRADEITDLRTMVQPDVASKGLQQMFTRGGEVKSGMLHNMAYALLTIGKHYARLPDEDIQRLRRFCTKLKPKRQGMTAKNRTRLRQFDDPEALDRLLLLPVALQRAAEVKTLPPKRAAALVETALVIELLLMTALRIKNIAGLRMDENINWTRSSRRGVCHLAIDGRDVKNGEDCDFELEGSTAALLKLYIERYRARLAPASCRWLFSRRDGNGPVDPVVLAKRVKRTIRQRTGLMVNVHLFRSLGAKIYLDQNPGGYEVVRRVLRHKHLSTTTAAYTGMESISAAKQFDRTVRRRQEQAHSQRRPPQTGGRE